MALVWYTAAVVTLVIFTGSTANAALSNSTAETRTWKYIGYYVSKIGAAKLNTIGIPILPNTASVPSLGATIQVIPPQFQSPFTIASNSPSIPTIPSSGTIIQVVPPQFQSPFAISPDTAVFPNFPVVSDGVQPVSSPLSIPAASITPSPAPAATENTSPSPTIGPPPATTQSQETWQSLPLDILDSDLPIRPQPEFRPMFVEPSSSALGSPLPFATAPPVKDNSINHLPVVFTSNVPAATTASALPLPTGLTNGVLLSPNAIPLAQAPAATIGAPPTGLVQCGCVTAGTCISQTGLGGVISVRIVTQTPGATCSAGQQYCCTQTGAPQQSSCGLPNVISGVFPTPNQANFGEFPWSGIILNGQNQYIGGAALIDSTHLLTAAHLVASAGNGAGLKVRLGEWDLTGTYEPNAYVDIPILNIAIHPSFVASTLQHDIALITLQAPATLVANPTPQVNSVCLPAATEDFTGQTCLVAGWGKDSFAGNYQNIIKKVDVPVVGNAACQQLMRQTRLGSEWALDTTSFICAGGVASKDSCQGDGGNALVCLTSGRYVVAGITAGGVECGQSNVPGLYVRVASYLPWIAAQISGGTATPIPATGGIDPRRQG